MKKAIMIGWMMWNVFLAFSQGAMIVSDPTSIAQRLVLASEEMSEQIEQKYKFIEQIDIARKSYEESKKIQHRVEVVSSYVKKAKDAVEIIALGEDIMRISKAMRDKISSAEGISAEAKYHCLVEIINCTTNVAEIARQANAVVKDRSESNDVSMTDYERTQELRYLKGEMKQTKTEMLRVYHGLFAYPQVEKKASGLFNCTGL